MTERRPINRTNSLTAIRSEARDRNLRYPFEALYESTDYLLINIVDYKKIGDDNEILADKKVDVVNEYGYTTETKTVKTPVAGVIRNAGKLYNSNKKSDYGTIILPIPSNIQDGNSVTFGSSSLDGLTASVLEFVSTTVQDGTKLQLKDVPNYLQNLLKNATGMISNPEALAYFNRVIASQAANIPFGGNLTPAQLLARQTGNILNPNMELLFEGVNLRSFKFSFKMTPRNKDEAKAVKNIIRTLKKNMAPTVGGFYLNTPRIFELTYMKGANKHPFLHKFKQCALTDMSVNYTGEGTYATYGGRDEEGGGTPVSMVMDLGFKELEPIYSADYDSPEGQGGVGF